MPKRNFPQAFKATAAAGALLTFSLATAPASIAGNVGGYIQEGIGALRAIGNARRNADGGSSNTPAPTYTPPPAPVYTPPPVAPVYTPPVTNVQIRNPSITPRNDNYVSQPSRPFNNYRQPRIQTINYREQVQERERERVAHMRSRVQPVARQQPPRQPTLPPTPSPPEIVNVPKDSKTIAPAPSLDKKPDNSKFDTAWVSSSMLRVMNKF